MVLYVVEKFKYEFEWINIYVGPQCQCFRNGKRCLEIYKLPKVLIIQLKRYEDV